MNLELKAIKHSEFASQETNCFEAKIYLNGKLWAHISNEGHGGPDHIVPVKGAYNAPEFWEKVKEVSAHLAASEAGKAYTKETAEKYGGEGFAYDLETWAGDQLNDHLIRKDMKRVLNRKVAFIKDGSIFTIGYKGSKKPDADLIAEVYKRHPDCKILNTMNDATALEFWKAHG